MLVIGSLKSSKHFMNLRMFDQSFHTTFGAGQLSEKMVGQIRRSYGKGFGSSAASVTERWIFLKSLIFVTDYNHIWIFPQKWRESFTKIGVSACLICLKVTFEIVKSLSFEFSRQNDLQFFTKNDISAYQRKWGLYILVRISIENHEKNISWVDQGLNLRPLYYQTSTLPLSYLIWSHLSCNFYQIYNQCKWKHSLSSL